MKGSDANGKVQVLQGAASGKPKDLPDCYFYPVKFQESLQEIKYVGPNSQKRRGTYLA